MASSPVKLNAALASVRRLYFDTPPLIYYVEENPVYIARMDAVIAQMKSSAIQGVCSAITLAKVLSVPLRTGRIALVSEYRDILLNSREFVCLPVSQVAGELAADLRARYNLKTPDALHLATAMTSGCDTFLTNDAALKRVKEIGVLILDSLDLETPDSTTEPKPFTGL